MASGKSVVTANKKLIAQHGPQLSALAREHGGAISFGASVAGGVPVIDALQEGLAGDQLYKVCGILNGTCNYILTKLEREGVSFAAALAGAQAAGFAEADPTDDVDGYDARAKLVILTRIGLKAIVQPEQVPCTSIRSIQARWTSPTRTSSAAPFARSHGPSGATEASMLQCSPRWFRLIRPWRTSPAA